MQERKEEDRVVGKCDSTNSSDAKSSCGDSEEGNGFFKLIADVDNIAFDVSVSTESAVGTLR
jgi:hypothetical protein